MTSETISSNVHVHRFAKAAAEYCRLIENHSKLTPLQLIQQFAKLILTLYLTALDLPDLDIDVLSNGKHISDATWGKLYSDLREKLGTWNLYWEFFDPYDEKEPVRSSMADDLADIYRDLKEGVDLFETGTEVDMRSAVWVWRFGSMSHWGDHAVDTLRAMHRVLAESVADS